MPDPEPVTQIYSAEIVIRGVVVAQSRQHACKQLLENLDLDVPLGTILDFDVRAKAGLATDIDLKPALTLEDKYFSE